ncbi:MAG: ABC transporter ATP-binding protein [Clostridia bacterium]|nr:ABC transporter ATP-binding protein [Clostridia bacterium]
MKFREKVALTKRGVLTFHRYCPRYFWSVILRVLLETLTHYVPIYFSAKLLDALAAGASVKMLSLYVLLTVGLVFLLKLGENWFRSSEEGYMNDVYMEENWAFTQKSLSMAYSSLEDQKMKLAHERVRMDNQTGYNLYYLTLCTELIWRDTLQILFSGMILFSFFTLGSIPLWCKLGLLLLVGAKILLVAWKGKKTFALNDRFSKDTAEANMWSDKFYQYLSDYNAGKEIRLYATGDWLARKVADHEAPYWKLYCKVQAQSVLYNLPLLLTDGIIKLFLYGVLLYGALSGEVSVGSITKYVSSMLLLVGAISGLGSSLSIAVGNAFFLKRYFEYLDIQNPMYKGSLTVEKRDDRDYNVEFRNVSFRYPGSRNYALRNVNLTFRVGEKLAVVGLNGSGKTTFIKLLCRLYDPTEGEILLNGVNIQKYDYDEYMSIFSVVFQDFRLFAFSLGQNVAAGRTYDAVRVEESLCQVGFGNRLATLPKGLDTCLYREFDEDGVEISGGEAQKIAIARALYKNAPFIVLDEPTAALDPVSEYEVYSKFNEIAGDKTAIYISHRLASCRFCDTILVFRAGEIVEQGTHRELLENPQGEYHALWNAQAQYYTE